MGQGPGTRRQGFLLGTPQFGALVITAFVSNTGSWMQSFSEQWVVVGLAGAEAARWSGRLSFALGLAVLVLTPFGGALVDRFDRRRLLAASQIWLAAMAALLGLLALLPGGLTLPRLLVFALATGIGVALAVPAMHSLFPDLLPREKLAAASGFMSAQFNLSRMIGPALGALAIPFVGVAGTFLLNALSYLGLILLAFRLPGPTQAAQPRETSSYGQALALCRRDPELRLALLLSLVAGAFAWSYHAFVSVYAVRYLQAQASGAASLLACYGAGALLGSFLIARDRGDSPWMRLLWGFALYGLGLVLLGAWPHRLLAPWIVGGMGIAHALFGNLLSVVVQRQAPTALRGRINGLYITAILGLMPIGNLLAGEVAQALGVNGVRWVLGVQGLLMILAAFMASGRKKALQTP